MRAKVQKWGNSLAIRIPKPFAEDAGLAEASDVDLVVREGSLVVSKAPEKPSLASLLRKVTRDNLHGEVDLGDPSGREEW